MPQRQPCPCGLAPWAWLGLHIPPLAQRHRAPRARGTYLVYYNIYCVYGITYITLYLQLSSQSSIESCGIKIENRDSIGWNNTFTYILTKYANTDGELSWMRNEFLVIKKPFEKERIISIDSLEKKPSELSNLVENYKKNVP